MAVTAKLGEALQTTTRIRDMYAGQLAKANSPDAVAESPVLKTDSVTGTTRFTGTTRHLNPQLQTLFRNLGGQVNNEEQQKNALQQMADEIGRMDDGNIASLWKAALEKLDGLAKGTFSSAAFVESINRLAIEMNDTENTIQRQRTYADQAVGDAVTAVNVILEGLQALNERMASVRGTTGNSSAINDVKTAQDGLLNDLRKYMNVDVSVNNDLVSLSLQGVPLLNDQGAQKLTFTKAGTNIDASMSLAGGQLSGITAANGTNITALITSGKIKGGLEVRDTLAPNESLKFAQFVRETFTKFNAVMNSGTSYPPRETFTGTRDVSDGDNLTVTGDIYVYTVSSDGTYIDRQKLTTGARTVAQLRAEITGGLANTTSSIEGGPPGQLKLNGDAGQNTYLAFGGTGTIELAADASTQTNFSDFFGFQNLFTLSSGSLADANVAQQISVNTTFKSNPTMLPIGKLDTSVTAAPNRAVTDANYETATALLKQFGESGDTISFSAVGGFGAKNVPLQKYLVEYLATLVTLAKEQKSSYDQTHASFETAQENFLNDVGINVEETFLKISDILLLQEALAKMLEKTEESTKNLLASL